MPFVNKRLQPICSAGAPQTAELQRWGSYDQSLRKIRFSEYTPGAKSLTALLDHSGRCDLALDAQHSTALENGLSSVLPGRLAFGGVLHRLVWGRIPVITLCVK
jgi:hypothetical protein